MAANDYLVGTHWHDVIVIGAGHNGLVAALLLARQGLKVLVLEENAAFGGAARTERPFAKAPELATSSGALLFGLMPPELLIKMRVELPLVRRDPHYFLPTTGERYLVLGASQAEAKASFTRFFSAADWKAHVAMQTELAALRDDVAGTWLEEPLSIEGTAERYVRPPLRAAFVDLCRKSVGAYVDRWGFTSELARARYALDALFGVHGTWDTPGTGMGLLTSAMGRLPDSDGTWMVVSGGMGTVARMIADEAIKHGAILETERRVSSIVTESGVVKGVMTKDGTMHHATAVVCNTDPQRMRELVGRDKLPAEYNQLLDGYRTDGTTLRMSLALSGLPAFTCWPGGAFTTKGFAPTIQLVTDETNVLRQMKESFASMQRGELVDPPVIELHVHTTIDPSLQDPEGRHSATLLVQGVPHDLAGTTWDAEEAGYARRLLALVDRFAPGTSDLVVDAVTLHPAKIERHFGMTRGHVHHVDNSFGFGDRLPYAAPVPGLFSCSAGTHPAGGVIGAAGHNAAMRVLGELKKMGRQVKSYFPPPI